MASVQLHNLVAANLFVLVTKVCAKLFFCYLWLIGWDFWSMTWHYFRVPAMPICQSNLMLFGSDKSKTTQKPSLPHSLNLQ